MNNQKDNFSIYCSFKKFADQADCFESESEFSASLNNLLDRLTNEDKQKAVNYLNSKWPSLPYLKPFLSQSTTQNQKGWISNVFKKKQTVLSQFDFFQKYYEATVQNQIQVIIELLDNERFFENLGFPETLQDLMDVLGKLQGNGIKLLNILEYCLKPSLSIKINLISDILFFLFNSSQLTKDDQFDILLFIAQASGQLVVQFQNYLEELEDDDFEGFQQFITDLQLVQVGSKKNLDINKGQPNYQCYEIIYKVTKIDFISDTEKVQNEIMNIISNHNSNNNNQPFSIDLNQLNTDQVIYIYFSSLFTLWYLYCQEDIDNYKNQFSTMKEIVNIKKTLSCEIEKQGDYLTKFLLSKLFFFQSNFEESDQLLRNLYWEQKKHIKQLKLLRLSKMSQVFEKQNFQFIYQSIKINSWMQLQKVYQNQVIILEILKIIGSIRDSSFGKAKTFLQQTIQSKQCSDICQLLRLVQQQKQQFEKGELITLFQMLYQCFNFNSQDFKILNPLISEDYEIQNYQQYLVFAHTITNQNINIFINKFKEFSQITWNLVKQHYPQELLKQLTEFLLKNYLDKMPNSSPYILTIYKNISPVPDLQKYQIFEIFLQNRDEENIHQIFIKNNQNQLEVEDYQLTFDFLSGIVLQNNEQQIQIIKNSLKLIFKHSNFYNVEMIKNIGTLRLSKYDINLISHLIFLQEKNDRMGLIQKAKAFYMKDPEYYQNLIEPLSQYLPKELQTKEMERRIKYDKYPRGINVSLEEFNISLTQMTEEYQKQIVDDWVQDMSDNQKFKNLIPFFFNIIKRGESMKNFLSLVNRSISHHQEKNDLVEQNQIQQVDVENCDQEEQDNCFNLKSLFQIFYNNSNPELQVMLLKLYSKVQPIPLIYRTPYKEEGEHQPLSFNAYAFYVFPKSYTIINFSLNQIQKRIGKTELINKIFYETDKFEVCDNSEINSQTIDLMIDHSFSGSRNLTIADVHGFIPLDILDKILPLFKLWIIQVDTEKEIESVINSLQKLDSFKRDEKNNTIFLLIRNSLKKQLPQDLKEQLDKKKIIYQQMTDLTKRNLSKMSIDTEIESVAKNLYTVISQNLQSVVNQTGFLGLTKDLDQNTNTFTLEFEENQLIIQNIEAELENLITENDGFYGSKAFPLRNIDYTIKKLKKEYAELSSSKSEQQDLNNTPESDEKGNISLQETENRMIQITQLISQLQQQESKQQPTCLLILFCKIFKQPNFYILYLWFVDKIRQFNEKHTYKLQATNQELNQEISSLQKKKDMQKQQIQKNTAQSDPDDQIKQIQQDIISKKAELKKNLDIISLRNIGIELFWREIIQQQQKCDQFTLDIDPAQVVHSMIAKGEPFEMLDGDQLQIDQNFLENLIGKFQNQGKGKVLVLSVLGPQSSGKSTILNKIFGCHFWTSVGRCTKGIYLQILTIHNKQFFGDQFESILLLDTEGLQNPNQEDQEFDKKIALFVLAISDLILINVKGDIHQQFKNLVEMCLFTFGQMRSFSSTKQISWCFNQNNDVNNKDPFLAQLQAIANSLNLQLENDQEENQDYYSILGITDDNIQILGFASTEKTWRQSNSKGIYSDWRQQILNETFSEEAYLFGVKIISNFSNKLQQQDDKLSDLSYFVSNIKSVWQQIESLPDLLEFSELIQHKQNKSMRQQFDLIIASTNIAITSQIIKDIQTNIHKKGEKIEFNYLKELLIKQSADAKSQIKNLEERCLGQLLQFKNEKKISKKIHQKYEKMIKLRMQSQYSECYLQINNEIRNHETEFQQKRGFYSLEIYVKSLYLKDKLQELEKLRKDQGYLQKTFENLWNSILTQQINSQEDIFKEHSEKLFDIIAQEFSNYKFKSKNEGKHQEYFLKHLITQQPADTEFDEVFHEFREELKEQQFMVIEKNQKNYPYFENFHVKKIDQKLKDAKPTDIMKISDFYECIIVGKYVTQSEINRYLRQNLYQDIKNYLDLKKSFCSKNKQELVKYINFFFSQLSILGISYQQQDLELVISQIFQQQQWWNFFGDFQNSLNIFINKLNMELNLIQLDKQVLTTIRDYFKNLILSDYNCSYAENDKIEQAIQTIKRLQWNEQIIVLSKDFYVTSKLYSSQQKVHQQYGIQFNSYKIFDYIRNPSEQHHQQNDFKNNIIKLFTQLMENNDFEGWKKLYKQIYQIIFENIVDLNSVEIQQFSVSLIKLIMNKIEKMIRDDFNKQFSNFGIILNDFGERVIYNFSILIIWRLLCYGQWTQNQKSIEKLKAQTGDQFQKFKADILEDKKEQSIARGLALAKNIFKNAITNFYANNCDKAKNELLQYQNETSFSLIQKLDQQILERQDPNITDAQVMEYIRDHQGYIDKIVNLTISSIETQIKDKLQQTLRNETKQHLTKIFKNTRGLKLFIHEGIKAEEYFKIQVDKNDQETVKKCEQMLYKNVFDCIQGTTPEFINQIKDQYLNAFSVVNCVKTDAFLFEYKQNSTDSEIQILMTFVETFDEKIQEMIQDCDTLELDLGSLNVKNELSEMKLQQLGCLMSCPVCKRKCDEDPTEQDHTHQCKNGHQLRGMNGVLINKNPSLFTCEEISDEFQIEEQETKSVKKWKDFKTNYNNWLFSCLSNDDLKNHKQKFMNIWNNKIGQMICKQLEKDLGQPVYYIPKHEIDPKNQGSHGKIHYVLMLDDSGSMSGRPWENVKSGAINFMWEIQKNRLAAVTVIIFNSSARCVIEWEQLDPTNQEKKIQFDGGCTDFDEAFKLAYEKITKKPNFDQYDHHQMFFYTDGCASFPQQAMNKFKQLTGEQKQKIELIACTEESDARILDQIVAAFNIEIARAEVRKSVQPQQMGQVWIETISKKFHKLQC